MHKQIPKIQFTSTGAPQIDVIYDIPMALCRTIEIDLREILGKKELPAAIPSKNGVLM